MSNDKKNENQNGRRHFSPEDKITMLRLHLFEKVPISEVCEKHQIIPTQFYQWQKTFFENGAAAFAKASSPRVASQMEQKVAKLEEKLKTKDEVIAEIMEEIPTRILVSVRMETPGLVVLADLWDKGWEARLNGKRVPILRTNHAVRGVVVPAGSGLLEFRYAPAGFAWGLGSACLAAMALLLWGAITLRRHST